MVKGRNARCNNKQGVVGNLTNVCECRLKATAELILIGGKQELFGGPPGLVRVTK